MIIDDKTNKELQQNKSMELFYKYDFLRNQVNTNKIKINWSKF